MSGAVVCVVSDKSGAFTGTLAFCVRFPPGLWRPPEHGGLGRAAARPASVALVQEPRAWLCALTWPLLSGPRGEGSGLWSGRHRGDGDTVSPQEGQERTRAALHELGQSWLQGRRRWNGPDTPKRSASPPLLTAAASTGHLQSAGAFPTFSLRWSHVIEKETKAQRIPRSRRRDPGFEPRSGPRTGPRGQTLTRMLLGTARRGCLTSAAGSGADSEHPGRT